ncbi:MAG: DUF1461 domain-containing protein [[Clostridium] scindens]
MPRAYSAALVIFLAIAAFLGIAFATDFTRCFTIFHEIFYLPMTFGCLIRLRTIYDTDAQEAAFRTWLLLDRNCLPCHADDSVGNLPHLEGDNEG